MKFSHLTLPFLSAMPTVLGQSAGGNAVTVTDPGIDLDISLALPNATVAPFPLLVTFTAPVSVGWAGFATGGCMLRSPLIVAWPNGTAGVVATTRWAPYVLCSSSSPR
jgi:cellobiose dehydrogenase (acceptor)